MTEVYDFIVVGSGPAGCIVATCLAKSPRHPTVLLLEAGGSNDDRSLRVDGQRWLTFQKKDLNWGYKTTAQSNCNNREIDYSRGRGLGGSSAINFGVFTVGACGDYDEWARIVGDDAFRWEHMQGRLKRLETFHSEIPSGTDAKYVNPESSHHGTDGPLHTGFATEWERDLPEMLDIFEKADFPLNPDHNSGNPIGMSVLINSAHGGLRSTAADLLNPRPANLTVVVDSAVQRLVFHDKRAVGVVTKRKQYSASHEIVLCAGALDTPKILMHSGIGPAEQLEAYNVPVLHALPAVGRGLRDHLFVPLAYSRVDGSTDRAAFYGSQKAMDAALEKWQHDGSGPWAKFACELGAGFFKLERLVSSQEFRELPVEEQRYLLQTTVPHYEVLTHFPIHWFIPNFPSDSLNYSCLIVFQYNAQTRGEVSLQSSDPDMPLKFDPKFLAHPFDRRAAIEALRDVLRVTKSDPYTKDNIAEIAAPKSDSDEDLLDYWKENCSSSWHMTGTVKMGQSGDPDAAVDANFRLMGIEGLRVADLSVVPVLASCHTQAVSYLAGLTCAEKLIEEYQLTKV